MPNEKSPPLILLPGERISHRESKRRALAQV
jgi:hypothetical protein